MDLSSLITMVTIVFSMLKITRGLKIFWETGPRWQKMQPICLLHIQKFEINVHLYFWAIGTICSMELDLQSIHADTDTYTGLIVHDYMRGKVFILFIVGIYSIVLAF